MKGQSMERQKVFANDMTNKGLIFETYKQLIQLSFLKRPQLKMGIRFE